MAEARTIDRPITVGPFELRGRLYLPAHQPGLASGGRVTDRYVAYHRQRAAAGMAMQVTGATPVAPSAEWADICLWNIDESIVPGYRRLSDAVHAEGGRMLAQLAHPGPTEEEGPEVIGASRDFSEVSRQVALAATGSQIARVIEQYAAAADRCRRGGLDGVEISMAHGLFIASFLSPLTNHRDDEFGGDFERRLELAKRVLDATRTTLGPGRILGMRLGADDMVEGGLKPEEAGLIAAALEDRVDYISVMVGNNNRLEARVRHWPPAPAAPGLFRHVVRTVRRHVTRVPVAGVGRTLSLDLAEDMITAGDADMIGMVRAQIADPHLLPLSREGRTDDVRPCIGANVCINTLMEKRPLACLVNPDAGHSSSAEELPGLHGHRAVVVGAGPAGLEAARRLVVRGAEVTLFEAAAGLGGRMAQWGQAPARRDSLAWISWCARALATHGVDVRLGARAGAAEILECSPDTIVLATGAPQVHAPIPGDGSVHQVTADDVFAPGAVSGRAVVFDEIGNLDGALIADYLVIAGVDVSLVTSRIHVGDGEGINTLLPMLRRLAEQGIATAALQRPVRIADGCVEIEDIFAASRRLIPADVLVTWRGGDPSDALVRELRDHGASPW